jgi:hypothetical protein
MKKLIALLALLPALALGQSYPSPTFNNLTVNGTFTSTGNIGLASLAAQSANTVVANATGSSASPTAVALTSCSTANSALKYTSGTGFSCGTTFALTSGTLAQFAATTSAQLAGIISDESGSGSLVFATGAAINPTSTGATTAGTGAFTTLSASSTVSGTGFANYLASPPAIGGTTAAAGSFTTLNASSTITPSQTAGIVGTTTNNNANTGSFGEYQTATNSATSLTNGTPANATSISLTAGDWDVSGVARFNPGGSATTSNMTAGISTTSATFGAFQTYTVTVVPFSSTSGNSTTIPTPAVRISVASTTTVYLVAVCAFSASTMTADGFIRARRVR